MARYDEYQQKKVHNIIYYADDKLETTMKVLETISQSLREAAKTPSVVADQEEHEDLVGLADDIDDLLGEDVETEEDLEVGESL